MARYYQQKRGKYYYKCIYRPKLDATGRPVRDKNGRRIYELKRESLGVTSASVADDIIRKLNESAALEKHGLSPREASWPDFWNRYLESRKKKAARTQIKDRDVIEHFNERNPIAHVHEFTASIIDRYIAQMVKEGYEHSSIDRHLTTLLHLGKTAWTWKLVPHNLTDGIERFKREKSKRRRALSQQEIATAAAFPPLRARKWRLALLAGLVQGQRREEAVHIWWEDLSLSEDPKARTMTVQGKTWKDPKTGEAREWKPKDREYRTIPLFDEMYEELLDYRRELLGKGVKPAGWLIRNENGTRIDPGTLSTMMVRLLKMAGILGASYHTLRHTCGTMLIQMGYSRDFVMHFLGHSNYDTTEIYLHLDERFLLEKVKKDRFVLDLPAQNKHSGKASPSEK